MIDMLDNLAFVKYSAVTKLMKLKWLISFIVLSLFPLYCLNQLAYIAVESGTMMNLWDIVFYQFGTYMNLYLLIFPMYIFLISDLPKDQGMENYLFVRFESRTCWLKNKLAALFLFTLLYLCMSVVLCIFAGFFSLTPELSWSETILNEKSLAHITYFNREFHHLPPYSALGILLSLVFLSLLAQGCFQLYINLYFKKSAAPFTVGIVLNFIILILLKANYLWRNCDLMPYKRILLQYQTSDYQITNSNGVGFSALYWCIIIALLIAMISCKLKSTDFLFEVENEK